jgi:DNA gyrase subunit A
VLVVSEKGFGKRTQVDEYRITNRGGKGVKTINVTPKSGSLVGILDVTEREDLMITCRSGVTIRMPVTGISEQGRATQGVKLIRVDDGDEIAAITGLDELEITGAEIVVETNPEGSPVHAITEEEILPESAPDTTDNDDEASDENQSADDNQQPIV